MDASQRQVRNKQHQSKSFKKANIFIANFLPGHLIKSMIIFFLFTTGLELLSAPTAIYRTDFNKKNDWKKTEPASIVPFGRSGSCLKISTYDKNGDLAKWESPKLNIKPGAYTISGWTTNNLAFTQDPGYGGVVAAVLYDKNGKEIKRIELAKEWKRPHRDKYDFYAFPNKNGLPWRYFETGITVPANATSLNLVFTWANFTVSWRNVKKNVIGEIYLDDVMITAGKPKATGSADKNLKRQKYPYQLRINTPVYSNVFIKGDPLEFTVRLDGKNGPPAIKPGMVFHYRIEDYQRLLIDQGEVPLIQPYDYWQKNAVSKQKSLLKTFYLGAKTAKQIGRWMSIQVILKYQGKILAKGENAFAITNPLKYTKREMQYSHFWGSGRLAPPLNQNAPWGPSRRFNLDEKQNAFGVKSQGWDCDWKRRQPTKDSPIDFSKDHPTKDYPVHRASQKTFEFHERNPLGTHTIHYSQCRNLTPDWALVPGKKRTDNDFIDPQAYAAYVKEYVKHTNALYYYTTGIEGGSIERFPNMARAAYKAVKEVDPRLQVIAQVDFFHGKSLAEELCKDNLIDFVDILVFDNYSTRQGKGCREFRDYLEERGKHKQYWIQEYCYTGSLYQPERSRRMADYIVWALSHGIDKVRWYANHWITETVRSPLPSSGVVYGMNGMLKGQKEKLSASMTVLPRLVDKANNGYVQGNFFPYLQWCMYYHLQQHFAVEKPRYLLEWGKDIEGALFDGTDYSTAAVWKLSGTQSEHRLVEVGDNPFVVTDMYGRNRKIIPVCGKAWLTIGEDPLLFRFSKKVGDLSAKPATVEIAKSSEIITEGGEVTVTVKLKNDLGFPFATAVSIIVDDSWKTVPAQQNLSLNPGADGSVAFTLTAPEIVESGEYPFMVDITTTAGNVGWLKDSLTVSSKLDIKISAGPYSKNTDPAIIALLKNNTSKPITGTLTLHGDFGSDWRAIRPSLKVTVPAQQTKTVKVPFKGWIPNLNMDYDTKATFITESNDKFKSQRFISFRGVSRLKKKVVVDGDTKDWDFSVLVPFNFFKAHSRGGASWDGFDFKIDKMTWKGDEDASGKFYIQWDDDYLYFLFVLKDDIYKPGGKGVNIWSHDALHFLLYPFPVQPGKPIKGTNYKEHIGLDKDGKSTYDRMQGTVGNWAIGSGQPEGVKIAVKRIGKEVVMEFAVPIKQFAPLKPKPGEEFALSLLYYDRDSIKHKNGISWYYGQTNVDTNPEKFGNFKLMEK